jgi:Tol biopolymer transport system component
LTSDSGEVLSISTSGDGKRVLYLKGIPEPDVYVAELEAPGRISEPQRLTLDDRQDIPFDWTPNGKEVIFVSDRTGTFSIYRQAIDQKLPELVVGGSEPVMESRLSPDGTQILYLQYPNWGEHVTTVPLMRVPLAGGTPQKIVEANWISNHQCARAPAKICVYSVAGDNELTFFTFDVFKGKGAQVFQIKDDFPQLYNWSLSPDGTTLAIAKGKWGEGGDESPRVHLVSLVGVADRWLTIQGWPGVASLDWAADSRSLWAASIGEEENALLSIDLQGRVRPVWRPKKNSVGWAIPSRDGRYLALHVGSNTANAWMVEQP